MRQRQIVRRRLRGFAAHTPPADGLACSTMSAAMNPIQQAALSSATATSSGAAAALRRTPPAATAAAAATGGAAGAAGAAAEQVSISAAGQMLAAGAQNAPSAAGEARIAALQAAIQSGRYAVDPQRIARGLLQDSQSLLAASRPAAKTGSAR